MTESREIFQPCLPQATDPSEVHSTPETNITWAGRAAGGSTGDFQPHQRYHPSGVLSVSPRLPHSYPRLHAPLSVIYFLVLSTSLEGPLVMAEVK